MDSEGRHCNPEATIGVALTPDAPLVPASRSRLETPPGLVSTEVAPPAPPQGGRPASGRQGSAARPLLAKGFHASAGAVEVAAAAGDMAVDAGRNRHGRELDGSGSAGGSRCRRGADLFLDRPGCAGAGACTCCGTGPPRAAHSSWRRRAGLCAALQETVRAASEPRGVSAASGLRGRRPHRASWAPAGARHAEPHGSRALVAERIGGPRRRNNPAQRTAEAAPGAAVPAVTPGI